MATSSDDEVHFRFEAPHAVAAAVVLPFLWCLALTLISVLPAAHSAWEILATILWYLIMLGLCIFVLGPQTRFTGFKSVRLLKMLTWAAVALMLGIALLPVNRRGLGKISGTAQAAAVLAYTGRAWQLIREIERARATAEGADLQWGFGRRLYMMCSWAWHDLEQTKAIPKGLEHAHAKRLLRAMVGWLAFGAIVACTLKAYRAWIAPLPGVDWLLRASGGAAFVLAGFELFDLTIRTFHVLANGLDVPSIMGKRLFASDTLEGFWREWNVPVQRALAIGVYKPLVRRARCPAELAKVLCFVASGLAHVWPLAATGAPPWAVGSMCAFFVLQAPLLALEKMLQLRGWPWLYGALVLASPLFVEPLSALELEGR